MDNPKNIDTGNIKFSYKTLYVGAIATICLIVAFCIVAKCCNISYEIRDLISMLTCGIVITALIYSAKSLKLNFESNNEKLEFDKKKFEEEKELRNEELKRQKDKYTLEVSAIWFKPEMADNVETSRSFLRTNKEKLLSGPIIEMITELDNNQEARKAVVCILNFFENLSLLIKREIVDEESLKACFKTVFIDYFKVMRRYIDEIQKTSSRYLMNYEEVAKRWEKN